MSKQIILNKELDESKDYVEVNLLGPDMDELNLLAYKIQPCLKSQSGQIGVKIDDRYEVIRIEDINLIEVSQGELSIHCKDGIYLSKKSLSNFFEHLPKEDFIQISRFACVRISFIKYLEAAFAGNFYAFLRDGKRIDVSRRFVKELKERLSL